MKDYVDASSLTPSQRQAVNDAWSCPPPGYLKINVDAGYSAQEKMASCGFVIRDESGAVVLAGVSKKPDVQDVVQG